MKGKHEGVRAREYQSTFQLLLEASEMFPTCPQMSTLYAKILDRLEKAKLKRGPMEE